MRNSYQNKCGCQEIVDLFRRFLPVGDRSFFLYGSELYVSDTGNNAVKVFNVTDSGNAAPKRTIAGDETNLSGPRGLHVSDSKLYVANHGNDSVTVYNLNADGNALLVHYITGASTTLNNPQGVSVYYGTPSAPLLQSAQTNADGDKIILSFDKAMADPSGKHSKYRIAAGGYGHPVTAAALKDGDNTKIELSLAYTIIQGQTVSVSYKAGSVAAADGGVLASFAGKAVTNNSTADLTPPVLTPGTVSRLSNAHTTVKFNSSKAGTYYYEVVPDGLSPPTMNLTLAGTPCDTTEQTISLNELPCGPLDIYIIVKSTAGILSDRLTIDIPAAVTGNLSGNVKDVSGSPVADAAVTIEETARSAVTATDGSYIITGIPEGTYTIRTSKAGYNSQVAAGVVVSIGGPVTLDFVLPASNSPPNRKSGVPATASASAATNNAYTLALSTIFEDADGDPLTYKVSLNGTSAIAANENYSYTPNAAGTNTLVFKASDGTEDSTVDLGTLAGEIFSRSGTAIITLPFIP